MEFQSSYLIENEQLKERIQKNNSILREFDYLKPYALELQSKNRDLKQRIQSQQQENTKSLQARKLTLSLQIEQTKQDIEQMESSIDYPPSLLCPKLLEDNRVLKAEISQLLPSRAQNCYVERSKQTPEQRFLVVYEKCFLRSDTTLLEPKEILVLLKEIICVHHCLHELRSQFFILMTNTIKNPTFLMAFGVLPEIAQQRAQHEAQIINYFKSKWCRKTEEKLLLWLDNLPVIEELKGVERDFGREFSADQRSFDCGKVVNFVLVALLLQGHEIILEKDSIGCSFQNVTLLV